MEQFTFNAFHIFVQFGTEGVLENVMEWWGRGVVDRCLSLIFHCTKTWYKYKNKCCVHSQCGHTFNI